MTRRWTQSTPIAIATGIASLATLFVAWSWAEDETRRVASARALAAECEALAAQITADTSVLDEPASSLGREELLAILRSVGGTPNLDRITTRQSRRGSTELRQVEATLTGVSIEDLGSILQRVVTEYRSARFDSIAIDESNGTTGGQWDVTLLISVGLVSTDSSG